MQEKNILLCFLALPLRHKLIAAVIAVAISSGLFVWSRHGAARLSTTAEMSFDAAQAQQIDPNLSSAKDPAVALGRSVLKDDLIKGLMKRVGIHADVAEFRSRLEMTQQSPKSLNVKYQDLDKELSVAAANAVANLLVSWTPPSDAAVANPVPLQQALTSAAHPAETSRHSKHPSRAQSSHIRDLEAQLAATDQRLATLNSTPPSQNTIRKTNEPERTLSANDEQRQALEIQLNADQKQLDDLRVRYTDQYPDVENLKEDIAQIQQKLALIQSTGNKDKQLAILPPPNTGSSDVNQLRSERTRLLQAIAAEKRGEVTPHSEARVGGPTPPVPAPILSVPPSPSILHIKSPAPSLLLQSPFTLVRLASYNEAVSWWHALLAGILCGLLYLTSAVWRYMPISSVAVQRPLTAGSSSGAEPANSFTDFQDWEKEVKQALALTDIGREEEAVAAREEAVVGQQQVDRGSGIKGQLLYEEISQAIQEKVKREPDSWMAHTEGARAALAGGDYDTAIKEINLAITVAPEKLKPQLDRIITRLDRNVSHT